MSRIGVIGTGHIAAPMVRHLAAKGHTFAVTRRSEAVSAELSAQLGVKVAGAQEVLNGSDIVLLCLRPHQVAALEPLVFRADHAVVSVMAGISAAALQGLCAPATRFVQTIPLGFLEVGGCPLAGFGDTALLEHLFAPENPVVAVASEDALNAHFAICAMVPGLLDLMQTSADWLTDQTGDATGAGFYTAQLMAGYLASMEKGAGRLAAERDALATEGTISLQMTEALQAGGAHAALSSALAAITERLTAS